MLGKYTSHLFYIYLRGTTEAEAELVLNSQDSSEGGNHTVAVSVSLVEYPAAVPLNQPVYFEIVTCETAVAPIILKDDCPEQEVLYDYTLTAVLVPIFSLVFLIIGFFTGRALKNK